MTVQALEMRRQVNFEKLSFGLRLKRKLKLWIQNRNMIILKI